MAIPNTPLSEFLHLVLPYAKGVPEPLAEGMLRQAAIEFCERTRCWRHLVTLPVTAANRTVAAPANTAIHEFEEARWNGIELTPVAFTDADPNELTGRNDIGSPKFIAQIEPGMVSIYPYQTGTLRLSMFLKPRHGQAYGVDASNPLSDALNVVPEFLLTQHGEAIAYGALARLLAIPGEEWSNPALAMTFAGVFEQKAGGHSARNMRGQQRAPIRTKPQWM